MGVAVAVGPGGWGRALQVGTKVKQEGYGGLGLVGRTQGVQPYDQEGLPHPFCHLLQCRP